MKKKTYNNVLKAANLITKKGYEEKESLENVSLQAER